MKFELKPFIQAIVVIGLLMGIFFVLFGPGPSTDGTTMDHHAGEAVSETLASKVYVAVEGEAKIAVINPETRTVVRHIGLAGFSPHNVQVSPDNSAVWVTGNAAVHSHSSIFAETVHADTAGAPDEVIVIDPVRDAIVKRISIKPGIHLAHVVFSPDSKFVYVTAQAEGAIYKINAANYAVVKRVLAPEKSEPHGLRVSPDGKYAYIAMLGSKGLGMLDLKTDVFSETALGGAAVQSGVTPDNKTVVVSLYDTKQLAVYDVGDGAISYVNLPGTARGPIQMYPTPDSRFVYLADQGYYFSQPSGEWVYKIDLSTGKVVKEIRAGQAPHGVVVSRDGKFVYITNLLSNDVSVIDASSDREVVRVKVGKEPNGVTVWYKN